MSFLRHRLRTQTAILPHQANRRFFIPKRFPPPLNVTSVSATTTATVFSVTFSGDVSTKLGNTDGFTITVNAIGGTVTDVQQPGAKNQLLLTFTPSGLATHVVDVTYDGTGSLFEPLSKAPIGGWNETAVVP